MAISLYDISVTSYLQTLDAVGGFLAKALAHFRDTGVDPEEIVEARLVPDMLPFRFQVVSVAFHSGGAMNAVLVHGDAVGATLYYGKGAGAEPTASAMAQNRASRSPATTGSGPRGCAPRDRFQSPRGQPLKLLCRVPGHGGYSQAFACAPHPKLG